jgi:hypothetical protein
MDKTPVSKMSILQERINFAKNITKLIPKIPAPVKISNIPLAYPPVIINKKPKEPELR